MWRLSVKQIVLIAALASLGWTQARSTAAHIQLRAVVLPSVKLTPGSVSATNGTVLVRRTAEDRFEITIATARSGWPTEISVPVSVATNTRSYLLRVSSLSATTAGTITGTGNKYRSREFPLETNRTFAFVAHTPGPEGQVGNVIIQIQPQKEEEYGVKIEIEAVALM